MTSVLWGDRSTFSRPHKALSVDSGSTSKTSKAAPLNYSIGSGESQQKISKRIEGKRGGMYSLSKEEWGGGGMRDASRALSIDRYSTSETGKAAPLHVQCHYGITRKRFLLLAHREGDGGAGVLTIMHGRSRMTTDSRILPMPGRSTLGFTNQADIASMKRKAQREVLGESQEG